VGADAQVAVTCGVYVHCAGGWRSRPSLEVSTVDDGDITTSRQPLSGNLTRNVVL
jgi:hypothetical protein